MLSYRLQGLVPDWLVAFSFSLAMAIDAIFALFLGFLYDKYKLKVFYFIFIANSLPAILAVLPNPILLILAVASFGIGMGAQESIYRSVIADLTPIHLRGTAYGIFNALYGLAWTVGGTVVGLLYDFNHPEVVAFFSILMELAAFYFTFKVEKSLHQ
ncbi:MAG: MFS transporter [Candidatus Brockarchaeota archaeon]|nr:MFS transporter [Candidatus Brockarchaeota archaeon]